MAVLVDSGGKIILFWLLQRTSPIKINLTAYVIPMIAGIMGMYLFSETLSSMMVGGFAIVLVGFGLIELKTLRREFLA
jgi:drug/metabolite transporter (DMT)-like permease